MKLEQQVVSLEVAQRLKELGVKQESLFHWTRSHTRKSGELKADSKYYLAFNKNKKHFSDYEFSAFTVAELGEMLPDYCQTVTMEESSRTQGKYKCYDSTVENWTMRDIKFYADTEADARGKMLIYLLENKLITQ